MQEIEPRSGRRRPSVVTIIVLVLAVIGLFSIIGTVLSAAFFLVKAAVVVAVVAVAAVLLWRFVIIGRPDQPDTERRRT